jgi:gliding motility-associated-like protein
MKMTLRLIVCVFLIFLAPEANATHLMGGEITWACQGDGTYIFTLKLYRDCNGNELALPIAIRVHNHPTISSIPVNVVSITDISPVCNGLSFVCGGASNADGEVQEIILRSNPISLAGVPPPEGWIFTFDECCRNLAITNLSFDPSPNLGFTLRAIMYPFNGQNESPCFDSSPVFAQVPALVICVDNPFIYNHNAYDVDQDSLVYAFAPSLDWLQGADFTSTTPPSLIFSPGFSPAAPFGPTVPTTLSSSSGEITFTPDQTGNYVSVVNVKAYKCGQLVAEIFREIQIVVINCGNNNPPVVNAPFIDPITSLPSFTTTVQAGDLVNFTITGIDNDISIIGVPQSLRITASGGNFGTNFTNPNTGCNFPPCATLNPAPPVVVPSNSSITFNWQTDCSHIASNDNCLVTTNAYKFQILFQDDFCPAPSYQSATINILVEAPPVPNSPSLRCLEVESNGDVSLTWIPPSDPDNQFNSYHIFHSNSSAGPFTVIDSIFNINQNTYTHVGANANVASGFYYIRTRGGCNGEIFNLPSNTLETIFLDVTDAGSGQIDLNWNPISIPALPSTTLPYQVFKQLPPAAFTNFATSAVNSYDDSMSGCLQDIFYRIEIPDASGCISISNVDGGPFSNDQPPLPPTLDSVSVNPITNEILLGWSPSPSGDTEFYVIYQILGSDSIALDTVPSNVNFYSIPGLNPQDESEQFFITSLDECNLEGLPSQIHATTHLRFRLLACEGRVELDWNSYNAWSDISTDYNVLVSLNGAPFQLEGSVSGIDNETISYSMNNLVPDGDYCVVIQSNAIAGTESSTSNEICFNANVQDLPDFTYLRRATVLSDGSAFSACLIDTASDISYFKVLRAPWPGIAFDTLITLPLPLNSNLLTYTDVTAQTSAQSYTYKYVLVDKCDNPSGISNPGRTIYLSGEAADGFINKVKWNSYTEWDAGVSGYTLYRSIDEGITFSELTSTAVDTSFNDLVLEQLDTTLRFCYWVRAIENAGNTYQVRDTSWSNVLCLTQKPTIYIPNAFIPQGPLPNNSFKAKGLYEKLARNYEFLIFNRWGEQIFKSTDTEEAWNGKYKSTFVQTGIYVYRIKFELPDGSKFDQRGSVLVID